MFIYYGRTYNAARMGRRLVEVVCDRCGTRYYYELSRIGTGASTAPYAIGSERAASSAQEKARQDANRRLEEEAELVPCPKCHWVNDHLVQGYRLGQYRNWGRVAAGLAFAGVCLSLVTAWAASISRTGVDGDTFVTVLTLGIALSLGIRVVLLQLRAWLRRRIRPNRDHPEPPRLPAGSPPALTLDPKLGGLRPVAQTPRSDSRGEAWIDYQLASGPLPPHCCQCLAPASPRHAYQRPLGSALRLDFPLCKACARRWNGRKWLGALIALLIWAAVVVPITFVLKLDEVGFWFVVGTAGLLIPIIGAMVAGKRMVPARVKIVDISRGVIRLRFQNEKYAETVVSQQDVMG